ncbi:unnamed protein product (macronuclear) [Paramecium tetraurelia]|uniref:Uncharacterized protein n=1 Tax=Paramecium tetraurelia TaxID=5888 RepID=A0DQN8_PARTE|nr:uncharacterized protein GSPATT00002755001 [Paramecium tetraurelia]CAK85355.1 unnamed protein product [Paramecium tetraurelia]|eukprot:XP_001452752.1 hypothetical protein (macronuclear) [Paramecium tetraurelia strain d4-2]
MDQSKIVHGQSLKFAIICLLSTKMRDDNSNSLQSMNSTGQILISVYQYQIQDYSSNIYCKTKNLDQKLSNFILIYSSKVDKRFSKKIG